MKTLIAFLKSKFLWINLLVAIVLALVLLFGTLVWTRFYTNHGESVTVPDLTGKYVEEAELELNDLGLSYQIIDSVYLRSFNPGEIAEQSPAAGTSVKQNRKIYLILNCRQRRKIALPNLIGESCRKAQSNLKALGFDADSILYKPYEFDGELLDILYNGHSVDKSEKLPDGSKLVLVVGKQDNENMVVVPNLIGLSYSEAISQIQEVELAVGNISYDVRPLSDTERQQYHVYIQTPPAGANVFRGKLVEMKLSRTRQSSQSSSEDFF